MMRDASGEVTDTAEVLLAEATDASKCSATLVDRVREFLAPALASREKPASRATTARGSGTIRGRYAGTSAGAKRRVPRQEGADDQSTLAATMGPFCMKLLNVIIKTLSSYSISAKNNTDAQRQVLNAVAPTAESDAPRVKPATTRRPTIRESTKTNTRRPASTARISKENNTLPVGPDQCLAECAELALEALEAIGKRLVLSDLAFEKAACAVATRLHGTRQYEKCLKMLMYVRARLYSDTETPKSKSALNATSGSRYLKNSSRSNVSTTRTLDPVCPPIPALLLVCPGASTKPEAQLSITINCMITALRCWLARSTDCDVSTLARVVMQAGGVYEACCSLPKEKEKNFQTLFRLFYQAANDAALDALSALKLRQLALRCFRYSSDFTMALFTSQALKFGLIFNRQAAALASVARHPALLDFYVNVLEISENLLVENVRPDLTSSSWWEFALDVAKKGEYHDFGKRLVKYVEDISTRPVAQSRQSLADHATQSFTTVEALLLKCQSILSETRDCTHLTTFAESAVQSLTLCRKRLESAALCQDDGVHICKGFLRVLESAGSLCRHMTRQDRTNEQVANVSGICDPVLADLVEIYNYLYHKRIVASGLNSTDTKRIGIALVEVYNALALSSMRKDDITGAWDRLNEAAELCTQHELADMMRWTASTYYGVGGIRYRLREFSSALECFSKACELLSQYIDHQQKNGHTVTSDIRLQLAKRYEMSAACRVMLGDHSGALCLLRNAYLTLVADEQPLVDDAPFDICRKLVDRYTKLRAPKSDYVPFLDFMGQELKDGEWLKVYHYELTLLQGLEPRRDSSRARIKVIDALLNGYQLPEYPIRRARMLIVKARVRNESHEKLDDTDDDSPQSLCETAIDLLKGALHGENPGKDISEIDKAANDLAMAYSSLGLYLAEAGRYQAKPFVLALQIYKKLLRPVVPFASKNPRCNNLDRVRRSIDNVEETYRHIQTMSDYFDMLNQSSNRIICLRLLLRMTTLMDDGANDMASQALVLYTNIADAYVTLGYTGQAGIALTQAKAMTDCHRCAVLSLLRYQLTYARYLDCIGNVKKAQIIFSAMTTSEDVTHASKRTGSEKSDGLCAAADAFATQSSMLLNAGNLAVAIQRIQKCLRLLNRAARSLSLYDNAEDELARSLQQLNLGASPTHTDEQQPHMRMFAQKQWQLLGRFLTCYLLLGTLYVVQGFIKQAEYYYQTGLTLAEQVHSHSFISEFLFRLAETRYRQYRLAESEAQLQRANDCQAEVYTELSVRDVVLSKVHAGEHNVRNDSFDGALSLYASASALIDEAMSPEAIALLEEKDATMVVQTPRERKLAVLSPIKQKALSVARPRQTASAPYECHSLSRLKFDVVTRAGAALFGKGKLDDAEAQLENADFSCQSDMELASYCATLAKLKLQRVLLALRSNHLYTMFADSAFSLPWYVPTTTSKPSTRQTKAYKATLALSNNIDQIRTMFQKALKCAHQYGSPQLLHELCHGLVFLNVMRAYLTVGVESAEPLHLAVESAFYLELAKGLTTRREMLLGLVEKADRNHQNARTSVWPDPISISGPDSAPKDRAAQGQGQDLLRSLYEGETQMSPEDFERDIVSKLPAEWLVCSISVDLEREDLYITRYENGNAPVVVRLPLQRQGLREGEDGGSTYSEIVSELQNILQESNAMMKNAASYVTLDDKKGWWSTRRTLDGRLKSLMRQVEMGWLGAFKGLLTSDDFDSPDLQNAVETFKKAIEKNISGAVGTKARRSKRPPVFTVEDSICRMLLRLGSSPAYEDVEDALYYLLDAYQYSGAGIDYDELDIDGMESDFRDALQAFYSVYTHRQAENTPEMSGKHTILILDKHLHMIPWESLPALRSTPIVRLPSIFSLRDTLATRANTRLTLDQSNAYYILNPSKDLKATQEEFMPFVKSRQQWSGLVGECPKEDDIAAALATKDLFIYFGHGGGEQYVRGQRVRELDRAAMALLLGCSSGCLTPTGEFDPYGTPLNYLLGGSPAIVANLWDVTDKDIDRFSKKMLQEWGLMDSASSCLPGERSIAEAVAAAREVCKLEYLTGAAPVVYGLPVFLSARKMECEPQA